MVVSAACPRSAADSLPLSLDWLLSLDCAMVLLFLEAPHCHEPLEQSVLGLGDLLLGEHARRPRLVELQEACADARLVVQLALGLLLDLLGDPDGGPNRRQRQCEQPGDQTHAALPAESSMSVKLYGGSGPT